MSQPAEFSVAEPAVLGVSVLGEEIAMVVRDATGDIVASNLVELTDGAPASAAAAFADLVESAPFRVADIVIACARDDVRAHLESVMHGPSAPAWASSVGFVDLPSVLAQAARREADGVVVAVALDGSGAVAAGRTIALVDASHGTAVEALEVPVGQQVPVTYPEGLQPLADYLAASSVPRVVCVGSGADTPGVVGAIESAGVRVTVVPAPVFALAQGTTQLLATTTHRITPAVGAAAPVPVAAVAAAVPPGAAPTAPADPALLATAPTTSSARGRTGFGLRWWAIGGAAGVAALVCLTVLVALFTGDDGTSPAATTSTVTVPGTTEQVTVTRTVAGDAATVTDEQTVTRTVTASPQTRTTERTVTETVTETAEATVTATESETVTETVTESPQGQSGGFGPQE
ncbi:hypothetical protein [Gordonia sp. NB41Y]|uniref:hypothetical protein n=1 Tax=Gordonia sp. NB41Y TaxID=875808 RepID=UPI00273BDE37|nr:hypothetical protein [Gordonia sp. NB41Y]WLP92448.1 hypothetical protein Q9K23_09560 [Gordonia sp. NB41Y]